MGVALDELMRAGVAALSQAEAELAPGVPVVPARYLRSPWALWRADPDGLTPGKLADVRARGRTEDVEGEVELRLLSLVVRLGKFSRGQTIKVRSYLVLDGSPTSLKVWKGFDESSSPGARERRVRAVVSGVEGYRAPRVLAEGRVGDVDYIAEPVVYGRHPSTPAERLGAAVELGTALCEGYRSTAIGDRRLSACTHPEFRRRVETALHDADLPWDGAARALERLRAPLLRLIDRDRRLPVATTHGDLVASNVIRASDGRHHLVDWEHGRTDPIAFDLVKLILTSGNPTEALQGLAKATRPFDRRGIRGYRWDEQLALGLARFLSWSDAGRKNAAAVRRLDRYEAEQRQRLSLLATLLGD